MTYNPNLAKVKVNLHTKFQGRRSNSSAVRAQTDIQMDTTNYIISLASRSINVHSYTELMVEVPKLGFFLARQDVVLLLTVKVNKVNNDLGGGN